MTSWPELGKDACPQLVDGTYYCGLLFGHDGPCTQYVPGHYLPLPILHPLDRLLVCIRAVDGVRLCPNGCSPLRRLRCMWGDYISDLTSISRDPLTQVVYTTDEDKHVEQESPIRFEPCGCEFREIVAPDHQAALLPFVMVNLGKW